MAADPLPKYQEFFRPVLEALDGMGGSGSLDEINDAAFALMSLSSDQLELVYASGKGTIAHDRIAWARSHLKIAGLLASGGRGIWLLTDDGRSAMGWPESALRTFVADAVRKKHAVRKPPEKAVSTQIEDEAILDWRDELLVHLRRIEPSAFERLCQRLLRESGFVKVEVTGKSGDGGIDGRGILNLGLLSFHVLFQCKRYQGSVGAGAVRDFRGAMMGRTDKGLILTTGTFSPDARREATRDGAPPIDLIDGDALCEKLKDLELGVETRLVEEVSIKSDWFDLL